MTLLEAIQSSRPVALLHRDAWPICDQVLRRKGELYMLTYGDETPYSPSVIDLFANDWKVIFFSKDKREV